MYKYSYTMIAFHCTVTELCLELAGELQAHGAPLPVSHIWLFTSVEVKRLTAKR